MQTPKELNDVMSWKFSEEQDKRFEDVARLAFELLASLGFPKGNHDLTNLIDPRACCWIFAPFPVCLAIFDGKDKRTRTRILGDYSD